MGNTFTMIHRHEGGVYGLARSHTNKPKNTFYRDISAIIFTQRRTTMRNIIAVMIVLMMLLFYVPLSEAADYGQVSPKVIATSPKNGAANVDPSLSRIAVTFNKQMLDKSWSWSYEDRESFPQTTGQPSYTDDGTTCVLPVKLISGKRYVIWINTSRFRNFKDRSGNAAEPYKLVFTTRQK